MWIQVRNSDDVVTRLGETKRSPRPDTSDYEVATIPSIAEGEILKYDGSSFTIDPNTAERRARMEPLLLVLYRKWQDAKAIGLTCEPHCKAEYDAQKAIYDAL
tara:strand:+ start:346 stop:654 length:309 start_codon:yes stop_codon:yes gene_type:complete